MGQCQVQVRALMAPHPCATDTVWHNDTKAGRVQLLQILPYPTPHSSWPLLCRGAPNHPGARSGVLSSRRGPSCQDGGPSCHGGVPAPREGAAGEAGCRREVNNAANPCLPTPSSPGFEKQHITLISRHEFLSPNRVMRRL